MTTVIFKHFSRFVKFFHIWHLRELEFILVPILIDLSHILMSGYVFWKSSPRYLLLASGFTNVYHPWKTLKVHLWFIGRYENLCTLHVYLDQIYATIINLFINCVIVSMFSSTLGFTALSWKWPIWRITPCQRKKNYLTLKGTMVGCFQK